MFDYGGFSILDSLELIGEKGSLIVKAEHKLDKAFLKYHFDHFYDEENR